MSLEWLGGYARLDGMSLETGDEDGAVLRSPVAAKRLAPATWGALDIAPRYADPVAAGAAFLDGREGYLVVPYAPALNSPAVTMESLIERDGKDSQETGHIDGLEGSFLPEVERGHAGYGTASLKGWHTGGAISRTTP